MARTPPKNQIGIMLEAEIFGGPETQKILAQIPDALRREVMEPMVQRLVKMGVKIARNNLRRMLPLRNPDTRRWKRPTGALHDSLGQKVVPRSKMRKKGLVWGSFGARSEFRVRKTTTRKVRKLTHTRPLFVGHRFHPGLMGMKKRQFRKGEAIVPYHYIHLVNFGHRGAPEHRIPPAVPYPFMTLAAEAVRAIASTLGPQMFRELFPRSVHRIAKRMGRSASRRMARSIS